MGFYNKKLVDGLMGRGYFCHECGEEMIFEDEWRSILVCEKCGHSVELERYGFEGDESYENLYPTIEELDD